MKPVTSFLIVIGCVSFATAQQPATPASLGAALDRQLSRVEGRITAAVQAMAEDEFNFTPDRLGIKSANFKGARWKEF